MKPLSLLIVALVAILLPVRVEAHNANQLPFVSVNGENAQVYPVGSTSLTDLTLPQDLISPLVLGTKADFKLLVENLPILPEYVSKTDFHWDFGDGTDAHGLEVSHTFGKIGSYAVRLNSNTALAGTEPQLLDIIMINIVPDGKYQLPKAHILVDGRESSNPYTEVLKANLHGSIYLDASKSIAGTAAISSYLWDFGDQQRGSGPHASHTYAAVLNYVIPLVRVTDANGFYADQLVQVVDDPTVAAYSPPPATPSGPDWGLYGIGTGLVLATLAGGYLLLRRQPRHR